MLKSTAQVLRKTPRLLAHNSSNAAGFVDALLWNVWRCMSKYDQGYNPGMSRKRNCGDDSATLKGKRPDLCVLSSRAMLFKGEDKTAESDLTLAVHELGTKMKHWGAAFHGKVWHLRYLTVKSWYKLHLHQLVLATSYNMCCFSKWHGQP